MQRVSLEVNELDQKQGSLTEDAEDEVVFTSSLKLLSLAFKEGAVLLHYLIGIGVALILNEELAEGRISLVEIVANRTLSGKHLSQMLDLL